MVHGALTELPSSALSICFTPLVNEKVKQFFKLVYVVCSYFCVAVSCKHI